MAQHLAPTFRICHYYVDEAGDGTLFDSRGRTIIGTPGCSIFFILGLLEISNPFLSGHPEPVEGRFDKLSAPDHFAWPTKCEQLMSLLNA
jgi:hypothetical protein